jgi:cytochrome c oxidase cbb3-type subunit IV
MDINTLRTAITVLALITFLAIVAWAWSSRRRADFEAAARLPLDDDEPSNDAPREKAP